MTRSVYKVEVCDNGWILDWYVTGTTQHYTEVFDDAGAFLTRLGHLVGALKDDEYIETWAHGTMRTASEILAELGDDEVPLNNGSAR